MNATEFEKATEFIRLESPENPWSETVIAKFEARRSVQVSRDVLTSARVDDTMRRIKKDLLLKLMFDVYENRQKEMIESTAEFLVASPYGVELIEARNKVVQAALRQPDATIETLMRMYKDEILQPTKPE